jgi:hypothetical protein
MKHPHMSRKAELPLRYGPEEGSLSNTCREKRYMITLNTCQEERKRVVCKESHSEELISNENITTDNEECLTHVLPPLEAEIAHRWSTICVKAGAHICGGSSCSLVVNTGENIGLE